MKTAFFLVLLLALLAPLVGTGLIMAARAHWFAEEPGAAAAAPAESCPDLRAR